MVNKVKTLGSLLLKLETLGKKGSGRKMLLLNISFFVPGVLIPWLLFRQNADPTGFQFAFITFLCYSLIIAFTIITELDNLVTSRTEAEILSAMPVNLDTLLSAKMYMYNRYLLMLSAPLLLPGSIFFYAILRSLPRALMFYIAALMLIYFTANILLLVYTAALRIFKTARAGSYTLIFQSALILVMIMAYQFVSFGITGKPGSSAAGLISQLQTKGIIDYLPPAWFAFLTARVKYELEFSLVAKITLPLLITIFSYYSFKLYLKENYVYIRDKFVNSRIITAGDASKNKFIVFKWYDDFITNIYLRNNTERSSFGLMRSLYKKDKTVKLAILPMVLIPAGLGIFALLTNQLPSPFDKNYFEVKPVFHIALLLSLLVVLNTAIIGVKVTNFPGAEWIYYAYPVSARRNFKNGFRKFFVIYLLVPVSIALGIIFMIKIPMHQALLSVLFIFVCANLYNSVYNLFSRVLPFTKNNTLLNSLQRMTSVIYPFIFGIFFVMVQLFLYKSMMNTIIGILVILAVTFWVNYFGFVRKKALK
jgi:hypothetical protein